MFNRIRHPVSGTGEPSTQTSRSRRPSTPVLPVLAPHDEFGRKRLGRVEAA